MEDSLVEIVLMDGRFACIRKPTVGDLVSCYDASSMTMMVKLFARIVTIDGKHLAVADWEMMDMDVAMPIMQHVSSLVSKALSIRGVA
jgi:hypothetical protein